ncbi:unnamed protein product [Ascophyllum nodosum]
MMKPAVGIALAFTFQQGTSVEAFMRLPRLSVRPFLVSHTPRSFKRQRHPKRRAAHQPQLTEDGVWEGPPLLELDVVEYQKQGEDTLELGSYIGDGRIQPLLTREESGPDLFFHDEEAQPVSVSSESCRIVRVLDQVYVSQRIVGDRIKNPHGEEAEDCFLVEGQLNPSVVVRVERSEG